METSSDGVTGSLLWKHSDYLRMFYGDWADYKMKKQCFLEWKIDSKTWN
ncbi:MAG: hypothetical protein ACLTJ5_14740 [Clostridium sp.]